MPTTNIDDVLLGTATQKQPAVKEEIESDYQESPEEIEEFEPEASEYEEETEPTDSLEDSKEDDESAESDTQKTPEFDEYGNEKERMPKGFKDRLDRKDKQYQKEIEQREREINELRAQLHQQGASPQVQKAAKDFEYDPDASGDWQQQLAGFVKQTVNNMSREEHERRMRAEEASVQHEFEAKFNKGLSKFHDFKDVIESLPFEISNPMTMATRAMEDPVAFLYAAAKRNPKELERISKIKDPYAQVTEMGRLEERMRKNKTTTSAPRPLSRSSDDAGTPVSKKSKEPTIEDLIAKSDAKRMDKMRRSRGR